MKQLFTSIFLISAMTLVSCDNTSETVEKQREEYLQKIEGRLETTEKDITAFQQHTDSLMAEQKEEIETRVDSLLSKQEVARLKFAELREVGAEEWEKARTEMKTIMTELDSLSQVAQKW